MSVVILKMSSGEEVICGCDNPSAGKYVVEKPRMIHIMQDDSGNARAGLAPWIVSAPDATVTIETGVVACVPAPTDIEKAYLSQTSRIQLLG